MSAYSREAATCLRAMIIVATTVPKPAANARTPAMRVCQWSSESMAILIIDGDLDHGDWTRNSPTCPRSRRNGRGSASTSAAGPWNQGLACRVTISLTRALPMTPPKSMVEPHPRLAELPGVEIVAEQRRTKRAAPYRPACGWQGLDAAEPQGQRNAGRGRQSYAVQRLRQALTLADARHHHAVQIVFVGGSPEHYPQRPPPRYPKQTREPWRPRTKPPSKAEATAALLRRIDPPARDLAPADRRIDGSTSTVDSAHGDNRTISP